jgi:membrane protease YdiL (CAAX protease family)
VSQEELRESPEGPHAGQAAGRGFTKTAWAIVAILVLASIFWQIYRGEKVARSPASGVQQDVLEIQGRYLVGASQVPGLPPAQLFESAKTLSRGPLSTRLRFVVLAGEMAGPGEALQQLDAVETYMSEQSEPVSEKHERLAAVLRRLYSDYQAGKWDAPSLTSDDTTLLRDDLGWFGALALAAKRPESEADSATADPARESLMASAWRTFCLVILAVFLLLGLGFAGLAGAITFLAFLVTGRIRSGIITGGANSGIYAETFAVWMLLFTALSLTGAFLVRNHPEHQLLLNSVVSIMTLGALIWPVVRGVPWNQVRHEIGWFVGGKPIREIVWGIVCYVSNFPLVTIGLLATFALQWLYGALAGNPVGFEPTEAPTHPVVEWTRGAEWLGRLHILVLAAVIAPVIEETIFRGVLYRHLREGTARWRTAASVLFSVLFNGFVFAAIHPQGLLAIPALMSVAAGLSLAREWRGSLLAPITMHAVNNGVLMLLLFTLL